MQDQESYYRGDCPACGDDMFKECDCCSSCEDCCECETDILENGVEVTTGKAVNGLQSINISSKDSGVDLRGLFHS